MIKIKNLSVGYGGEEKIHDLSCEFKKGEITVLIGPNGCGKSTLLKAVSGVLPFEKGEIEIDGNETGNLTGSKLAQTLAYLPQNRNTPAITVERMVLHGRFPYLSYPRKYKKHDFEIAQNAMEQTGAIKYKGLHINNLSGGEKQKVYLAMALAQDTTIVMLDEPTTFLDIYQQLDVLQMVKTLKQSGKTVIMVLHDLNLALQCADTIVVMHDGRVIKTGEPKNIIDSDVFEKVFNVKTKVCYTESDEICYFFKI